MTPEEIIADIKKNAAEWLEMENNPEEFISRVLAMRVSHLYGEIEYLKRRLEYVSM